MRQFHYATRAKRVYTVTDGYTFTPFGSHTLFEMRCCTEVVEGVVVVQGHLDRYALGCMETERADTICMVALQSVPAFVGCGFVRNAAGSAAARTRFNQ